MTDCISREYVLKCMEDSYQNAGISAEAKAKMTRWLNKAPAADVVPVRHGRWVKVHDEVCYWFACSVCGEEIPKRFGTDYYTNFCPNCGAWMEES